MKILTDILDIGFEKPEFSRQMRKAWQFTWYQKVKLYAKHQDSLGFVSK
jgi:hypothetical protein